ncbi:sulfotransferase [Candidatus Thiomargarita nelsonii]|uniref:Sulfotransferase n=1 Tax=Candidatus Thiomargarita nelsonii TaxID=1003181 RepID=A0A0A6P2E7_9GAMM|nr:sulfotransferase [Candidatus Thiomargarita nelsonii]
MRVIINDRKRNVPDFLFVGTGKSGTTSIHFYLKQHPQLFLPEIKEPKFFHIVSNPNQSMQKYAKYIVQDFESYLALFDEAKTEQLCGEVTPSYLYFHNYAIPNIKKYHPEWEKLKIIIILRNPVEKAFSQYVFAKNTHGLTSETFEEGLSREPMRLKTGDSPPDLFYVDSSMYYSSVKAYMDSFKEVKVFLYDELKNSPEMLMADMLSFIGANKDFVKQMELGKRYNPGQNTLVPRNFGSRVISSILNLNPSLIKKVLRDVLGQHQMSKAREYLFKEKKEVMSEETAIRLRDTFREDVRRLEKLINRDLSHWY